MDMTYDSVQKILSDNLDLKQCWCNWLPHHLTAEQIGTRVESCQEWLYYFARNPTFFNNAISCDETWVYHFNSLSKQGSSRW